MNKFRVYLKEVYVEMATKVTWPTWKELQNSAIIVMVASFIFAIIVFAMDFSFEHIMSFVYKLLL